jgi:hypothetical protein
MKKRLRNKLRSSLLAYVNRTLSRPGRLMIEMWLGRDAAARAELAQLRRLQQGIALSARRQAPKGVLERVRMQVREEATVAGSDVQQVEHQRLTPRLSWVMVVLLALLAGAIVWFAGPPVVSLEWSVSAGQPSEFRIYRARLDEGLDAGNADFVLLSEIQAGSSKQDYKYTDLQLLPGQKYMYRVEALDVSGAVVKSNTTLSDSLDALPAQLLLLAASLILLYGLAEFVLRSQATDRWASSDRGSLS